MITNKFSARLSNSIFENNSAIPRMKFNPLTYSGSGGAMFVQSSSLVIEDSEFRTNFVITGQFDAGAAGGALTLEDSYPVEITSCDFLGNGASGFFGYSPFAKPGVGGAMYIKFSSADIMGCNFVSNWGSAGVGEDSIGGAIAGTIIRCNNVF